MQEKSCVKIDQSPQLKRIYSTGQTRHQMLPDLANTAEYIFLSISVKKFIYERFKQIHRPVHQ